jgi:hypothetical protein
VRHRCVIASGLALELHGLDDGVITLGEVQALGEDLHLDDMRLAVELTSRENVEHGALSRRAPELIQPFFFAPRTIGVPPGSSPPRNERLLKRTARP